MKKHLIIAIILPVSLLAFYSGVNSEVASHVVINEVQISGEGGAKDEFIRLYNPLSDDINLSEWRLSKITKSGGRYNLLTKFPDYIIEGNSFLTISHPNYSGEKDLEYSSSQSMASNNAIILYSDNGKTEVDKVAFGDNVYGEGNVIPNLSSGVSVKRIEDGWDTNNNYADFVIEKEPGEENPPEERAATLSIKGVFINEIMPNPKKPALDSKDEWIELKNRTKKRIDLSGAVLRDGIGSIHKYSIPDGTFVNPGSFIVFYSSATRISLNNSGDFVELLDRDGNIIDSSGNSYGKAEDGYSYAFDGAGWRWTLNPTPLAENIVVYEREEDVMKKVISSKNKSSPKTKVTKSDKKGTTKKVKGGSVAGNNMSENDSIVEDKNNLLNNRDFGKILLTLSGVLGISYIVFREKIYEILK